MKKCPMCAEEIQDEALKCRYCQTIIDLPEEIKNPPTPPGIIEFSLSNKTMTTIATVVMALILGCVLWLVFCVGGAYTIGGK